MFFFCLFAVLCFFYVLYKSTVNIRKKKSCFRIHLLLLEITSWCDDIYSAQVVSMEDRSLELRGGLFPSKSKESKLMQAELSEEHFWMLAEISPFHSEKVIYALRDFLVFGYTRREVCERHGVSPSYFSVSLGRMSHVNRVVFSLIPYYSKELSSVGYLTVPDRS